MRWTATAFLLAVLVAAAHAEDDPDQSDQRGWREVVANGCDTSCRENASSEGQASFCRPFCACLVRGIDERKTDSGAERFLEDLRQGSSQAQRENQEITQACLAELEAATEH